MNRPEKNTRKPGPAAVSGEELFLSRELSWLDFNLRVLDEAAATANPLLERLKFLAITGGNLSKACPPFMPVS